MAEPLLDISTIVPDRETVRIEGTTYEIARGDDFGLEDRRVLSNAWKRVMEIEQKEAISKTDETEYDNLIIKLVRMVLLDCPKNLVPKIPRSSREAIVLAFFGSSNDPRTKVALMQAMRAEALLTGQTSSPDSNDSTTETQSVGRESQPVS